MNYIPYVNSRVQVSFMVTATNISFDFEAIVGMSFCPFKGLYF